MAIKGTGLEVEDFLGSLIDTINNELGHSDAASNIVEFLAKEVDREAWGVKEIHRRQLLILKTFYGLELDPEDIAILEAWYAMDRTSINPDFYQPGEQAQSLCLEAGRRGSKCITLDTLIPTDQGFIEAAELKLDPTLEWQDINFNVAIPGKVVSKADRRFYNGEAEVRRIRTHNGYYIGATHNHRLKILDKSGVIRWEYMDKLQVGDVICIERNSNLWADSYTDVSSYFTKALQDFSLTELDTSLLPKLFDEEYGYYLGLMCADKLTAISITQLTDLKVDSNVKKRFFEYLGYSSSDKMTRVPWIVRKSPKKVVASFLSGLFDAGGRVTFKEVSLSTVSRKLAEEVQILLLNFGIVTKIISKFVKDKEYYVVTLSGVNSRILFSEEIKFRLPRYQNKLVASLAKRKEDYYTESIPYQTNWLKRLLVCLQNKSQVAEEVLSNITKDLTAKANSNLSPRRQFKKIVGDSLKPTSSKNLTYGKLRKLLHWVNNQTEINFDKEAIQHFIDLLEKDYFFDRITFISNSKEETLDIGVPEYHCYTANGFTSHNSFSASIIVAYEFYRLCMMKSPQKHYGIASSTPIAIYCIATSATQTKRTIFGQARALLEYIPSIKRLIDQKKIIVGEEEVKYPDKLLHIYSGNSNSASQVGSSVILLAMDEVARFDEEGHAEGESNALKLWSNIGISGVTFGSDAKRIAISSAWCEGDAIQVLYNKSKTSKGRIGFRLRSWDLNPIHASRDNPIIQAEYDDDPRKAALEFEGIRFNKAYNFFNDTEVERAFTGNSVLKVSVLPPNDDNLVRLSVTEVRPFNQITVMHLDPAFVKDAYAIAFGHSEQRGDQKVAVIDALLAWEPDIGQQVGISNVYQTIYQIHNSRPLTKITSDHYNPETIQRLKSTGLNASIVNFSTSKQLEIYDFTRKLLHENRLIFPKDSLWSTKLKEELYGIQLIKGRKIDHTKDGCFVGDTRILLPDGTRPTIAELEGKEVWVYSCTQDGTIVPGRARGRKTKEVFNLVDVVLDTGSVIRCTPEHLFMLRTGEYIQAKDILPGISRLMPILSWSINDRVKEVIQVVLKSPIAVYDLEVDEWDNFALAAGVFVHNSKDLSDCVCTVAWHLMANQTSSLSFDTLAERTVRRSTSNNDDFADLSFQPTGRLLADQIKRGYSGWSTRDNSSGSWSYDEY